MHNWPERAIYTVEPHNGLWSVEFEGEHFDHTIDKEVAKASANKRARMTQDSGRPCSVRVHGEHSFYGRV